MITKDTYVLQLLHSTVNSMMALGWPIDDAGEDAGMVMIVAAAVPVL